MEECVGRSIPTCAWRGCLDFARLGVTPRVSCWYVAGTGMYVAAYLPTQYQKVLQGKWLYLGSAYRHGVAF